MPDCAAADCAVTDYPATECAAADSAATDCIEHDRVAQLFVREGPTLLFCTSATSIICFTMPSFQKKIFSKQKCRSSYCLTHEKALSCLTHYTNSWKRELVECTCQYSVSWEVLISLDESCVSPLALSQIHVKENKQGVTHNSMSWIK